MPEQKFQRSIAYKISIADLLSSQYTKTPNLEPNFIKIGEKEISRINIIGIIDSKFNQGNGISLDDGTGRIHVRWFEENKTFSNTNVGEVTLIIGKPREFSGEKYILPEIIKKLNSTKWMELRKIELKLNNSRTEPIKERKDPALSVVEETVKETGIYDKIISLIKNLDKGEGADFEEVKKELNTKNPEAAIKTVLEEGEIFEIKPGFLKVLE